MDAIARRHSDLIRLLNGGLIADLELNPRYEIVVDGKPAGYWEADFRYRVLIDDHVEVEDVIVSDTPISRFKKKIVEAIHNIEIVEIES